MAVNNTLSTIKGLASNETDASRGLKTGRMPSLIQPESYDLVKQAGFVVGVLTVLAIVYFVVRALRLMTSVVGKISVILSSISYKNDLFGSETA